MPRIHWFASCVLFLLFSVGDLEPIVSRHRTNDEDSVTKSGTVAKGSSGTVLNEFLQHIQQRDQQQQLDTIRQWQQQDQQLQRIQRQTEAQWGIVTQLRQLQKNVTASLEHLKQNTFAEKNWKSGTNVSSNQILVQQHFGGTDFFNRLWNEFKSEFGTVDSNYWIGNERLHKLTKDGKFKLRVDLLAKFNSRWYWAEYRLFRVHDEASGYTLNIGGYTGSAGDSLTYVNGRRFTTRDKDQDTVAQYNCALDPNHGGGFWYTGCAYGTLNSRHEAHYGFMWQHLPTGPSIPTGTNTKLLVSRMTLISQ